MGTATNGIICYGAIVDDEDAPFPWNDSPWDGDVEEWWTFSQHGEFTPSFYPYTDGGEHKPGVEAGDPRVRAYYDERRAFINATPPMPVEMVNSCSDDCPLWIVAVSGSVIEAARGFPAMFNPKTLVVSESSEKLARLFVREHLAGIVEPDAKFEWLLGSFWG